MSLRLIWAFPVTLLALAACFFIAGNMDVFSWSEGGRFIVVFIATATFVLTATCPLFEE